jgi:hypothetical protein
VSKSRYIPECFVYLFDIALPEYNIVPPALVGLAQVGLQQVLVHWLNDAATKNNF